LLTVASSRRWSGFGQIGSTFGGVGNGLLDGGSTMMTGRTADCAQALPDRNATCLHLHNLRDCNAQPRIRFQSVPGAALGRAMRQMTPTIATVIPSKKF